MALVVTVAAPTVMYLKSFLSTWAQDDAKALRTHLYSFIRRRWFDRQGRAYVPLQVLIGGVRFYFWGEMSDDEFRRRLLAAHALMDQLPDHVVESTPGPSEIGYFWNAETETWRGTAWALQEPEASFRAVYNPTDLFDWMNRKDSE